MTSSRLWLASVDGTTEGVLSWGRTRKTSTKRRHQDARWANIKELGEVGVSGEEHIVILLAITLLILVNQAISDDWCGTCLSSVYETVNNFQTVTGLALSSNCHHILDAMVTDLPQIVHTDDPKLAMPN